MLTWLSKDSLAFPPLDKALHEPDGLLAAGGDLSAPRLLKAYRHGCFPWFSPGQPILWWSPDPRFVLYPKELHLSRSLRKELKNTPWRVTYDQQFEQVIKACAGPRRQAGGTWISPAMQQAYLTLHRQGIAHSVEVWDGQQLIGGLYGLAIGRAFFGESMFSRVSSASKIGFATLAQQLEQWDFALIDCQMHSHYLESFGARFISRSTFAQELAQLIEQPSQARWPD